MFKAFLFLLSFAAFADFPKNDLKIYSDSVFQNGMTKEEFDQIIDRVSNVYTPIVKEKKASLIFSRKWDDPTVNASAIRFGGNAWFVNMYGGLARHPLITPDAFAVVVCHELGHHLGGYPTKGGLNGYWAAVEGQADYFATSKCMKQVFGKDNNLSIITEMYVEPTLIETCNKSYKDENDIAFCQRIGMASLSLTRMLASLKNMAEVSLDKKDTTVVSKINKDHPEAQCRLDTYLAGSVCKVNYLEEFDRKNPQPGACTKSKGFTEGLRPLCWYRPSRGE